MTTDDSFNSVCDFIAEYAAHLMGVGVHTSRVVRNSKRIGEAFGVEVQMCAFYNNIMISITDDETHAGLSVLIMASGVGSIVLYLS